MTKGQSWTHSSSACTRVIAEQGAQRGEWRKRTCATYNKRQKTNLTEKFEKNYSAFRPSNSATSSPVTLPSMQSLHIRSFDSTLRAFEEDKEKQEVTAEFAG